MQSAATVRTSHEDDVVPSTCADEQEQASLSRRIHSDEGGPGLACEVHRPVLTPTGRSLASYASQQDAHTHLLCPACIEICYAGWAPQIACCQLRTSTKGAWQLQQRSFAKEGPAHHKPDKHIIRPSAALGPVWQAALGHVSGLTPPHTVL